MDPTPPTDDLDMPGLERTPIADADLVEEGKIVSNVDETGTLHEVPEVAEKISEIEGKVGQAVDTAGAGPVKYIERQTSTHVLEPKVEVSNRPFTPSQRFDKTSSSVERVTTEVLTLNKPEDLIRYNSILQSCIVEGTHNMLEKRVEFHAATGSFIACVTYAAMLYKKQSL